MLTASVLVVSGAGAASAATGDYTIEMEAPATVPVRQSFSYEVTVDAEARVDAPLTGVVLTAQLPAGLKIEKVPTGGTSPVESYTFDPATGIAMFTLRDLVESLSSFAFTVSPVAANQMDTSTVLTTTLTGSDSLSGAVIPVTTSTGITGNLNYTPAKTAEVIVGGNNRDVTYYFNMSTDDSGSSSDTLTTWGQRFTDVLPVGATVSASHSGIGGSWTFTGDASTGITAVWERTDVPYGPSSDLMDNVQRRVWLDVNYPEGYFAVGSTPPANTVKLDVRDYSGTWQSRPAVTATSPEIIGGVGQKINIEKNANEYYNLKDFDNGNGNWMSTYRVAGSWLNNKDAATLDSLIVEDSSAYNAQNAAFFAQADIYQIRASFSPVLVKAKVPYTFEYTTTAGSAWKTYGSGLTTDSDLILATQTTGSVGFSGSTDADKTLNLPAGERITGWRVSVTPGASDPRLTDHSEIIVSTGFIPIAGGAAGARDDLTNTATVNAVRTDGTKMAQVTDSSTPNVVDQVPIITSLVAPSTLTVGETANYVANISNVDPARSYDDSVMAVVLPVGVYYDPTVGVSALYGTTPTSNVDVPLEGHGLTVTTTTVTGADGEHQVVVFTFDRLDSIRLAGQPKDRDERLGFQYNVPVTVVAQAYSPTNVRAYSVAYTDSPDFNKVPMGYWGSYYAADTFNLDRNLDTVAVGTAESPVAKAGGLLISKLVRPDSASAWGTSATVESPGTAQWQIFAKNILTDPVTDLVLFDRMPFAGDARSSEFAVTMASAVTGLPAGATVEYSTDATSADTGTWTSTFAGATSFRVTVPELKTNEEITIEIDATDVPAGLTYLSAATNDVTAAADYHGLARAFGSNTARILAGAHPALSLVKKTNGIEYSAAPGAVVATGSDVVWTYEVTNTGDAPLDNFVVADAFVDGAGATGTLTPTTSATGPLLPGDSRTFTATAPAVAGQYHNTATVTADAVDEHGVVLPNAVAPGVDESWYLAGRSGLTVVKTTNATDVPTAPGLLLKPGSDVTWEYVVTNTGDLPLTDVLVEDVDGDGNVVFTTTIPNLAAGESKNLDASGRTIEGQYSNTVTVSAAAPEAGGADLKAADTSYYYGVTTDLKVVKEVSASASGPWTKKTEVLAGSTAYWRISVTNAGNYPLTNVKLTDEALSHVSTIPVIQPGETITRVLTEDSVGKGYTNVVTVAADDPLNPQEGLSVEDEASIDLATLSGGLVMTGAGDGVWMVAGLLTLLGGGALLLSRRRRNRLA